ncbi:MULTISPECIES: GNAT family N-acetyltransferase [Pseudomonas]|uniref:GNAT family N-acetyltransferase n=1 Tax=Pseudomonas TaxID=286 RepID=UPI00289884F4|nr:MULTISPECIES: GNAT family N-acetyltransferase [Pseudomonas]
MNNKLNEEILSSIIPFLKPYLDEFYKLDRINLDEDEVEIRGLVDEEDVAKTKILRVVISHEHRQVYIPNIFIPVFMQHKGIGKKLISLIYQVAKSNGYNLFIVDLVPSFYKRLVKRGAFICEANETVQITDSTNLSTSYA